MQKYEALEGFPFRLLSRPDVPLTLNNVARGVLEIAWLCRETKESAAVLCWPTRVENVGVFHSLLQLNLIVTAESQPEAAAGSSGSYEPLITFFWPWTQAVPRFQNRILVDRDVFTAANFTLVRKNWACSSTPTHKLHYWLNCIKDLDPLRKKVRARGHRTTLLKHEEFQHPSLYEITLQAALPKDVPSWSDTYPAAKEGFLKRVLRYTIVCINDNKVFRIENAPIFMLGVPMGLSTRDLVGHKMFTARRPTLALVDLCNVGRLGKDWVKSAESFLDAMVKAFPEDIGGAPPAMVVTDDIFVLERLRKKILADYERKRRGAEARVSSYSYINVTQGIFHTKDCVQVGDVVPSFKVAQIAADIADMVVSARHIREELNEIGSDELVEAVQRTVFNTQRLVNMPGGLADLRNFRNYCADADEGAPAKWKKGRYSGLDINPLSDQSQLLSLLERGDAGSSRGRIEKLLQECRTLVEQLEVSTPLRIRIDLFLEEIRNAGAKAVLVYPNSMISSFAAWVLLANSSNGAEQDAAEAETVSIMDDRQAFDFLNTIIAENYRMCLVMPQQKTIARLLAQALLPSSISIICDGGTTLTLLRYVKMLQGVSGLDAVRPRLNVLIQALEEGVGNRIDMLESVDELSILSDILTVNMRYDPELGPVRGHPVVVETDEGLYIKACEGSMVLKYDSNNELQPFKKATVASLVLGDQFFVATPDLMDNLNDKFNLSAMATEHLHMYHMRVRDLAAKLPGTSMRQKAIALQCKMQQDSEGGSLPEISNIANVVRWISVDQLLGQPRDLVNPHAPKTAKLFTVFTKALGFSEAEAEWFRMVAIVSTRRIRIRAGLDRARLIYKVLLDPSSVEPYIRGDKGALKSIKDIACQHVLTAVQIIKEHEDAD